MVASSVFRASFALLSLLAPSVLAAPPAVRSTATVLTPVGEFPAANVHAVPEGGAVRHVDDEIHLVDKDGKVLHVEKHSNKKITSTSNATTPFVTGWTAYGSWYNTGSPINYFTTTWAVPAVPASNNGQTVFLFNSIEPAAGDSILQPVLQWGGSAAGGGAYWAVATWYVTGSSSYFTPLVQVSVGQVLTGIIELTAVSGSSYTYISEFTNVAGSSALQLSGSAQLVWATETLEAYGIVSNSDYPAGATSFYNIDVTTTTGTPSISWGASSDTADGVICTISQQGATNAVITINY